MKFATLVVVAFVVFVAWAGIPVSLASDGRGSFFGQRRGHGSAGETYGITEHRQWQRAREPRRNRRPMRRP